MIFSGVLQQQIWGQVFETSQNAGWTLNRQSSLYVLGLLQCEEAAAMGRVSSYQELHLIGLETGVVPRELKLHTPP